MESQLSTFMKNSTTKAKKRTQKEQARAGALQQSPSSVTPGDVELYQVQIARLRTTITKVQ
jgi:hypothetical protein